MALVFARHSGQQRALQTGRVIFNRVLFMSTSSQSLVKSLRTVLTIVSGKDKRKFWFLLFLAVLSAGVEIFIASLVALLAAVFASTEAVLNNPHFIWLKKMFGSAFLDEPRYLGLIVLCVVSVVIALKNLLGVYQQWQLSGFSEGIARGARRHIFKFYLRAPYLWVLNAGSTELLFGLNCCSSMGTALLTALQVFSNTFMLISLYIGLLIVAPVPALIFLVSLGGLGYVITKLVRRFVDRCAKQSFAAERSLYVIQQTAIHGLKEMRIYGREKSLYNSYSADLEAARIAKQKQLTVVKLPVSCLEILGFSTLIVVMCYLIFIQDAGMARISGIMGFMAAAAWRALPVANRTVESLTSIRTTLPYISKVSELIKLEKAYSGEIMPSFEKAEHNALQFTDSIEINRLGFKYPAALEESLKDISLKINKGQMVGIVGFSGAGKSTLANVIAGLLPRQSGDVLVDGVPLTRDNTSGWLSNIGYVAQSPFILNATLAENVALSRWGEEVDRTRVLKCCEMAALDFIDDLENGIDTVLGDRGVRLSGGEAQRVAIARSLYGEPELIIFDEATSALDMKNEQAIHRTVLSLHNRVTMIIIAHRLSTVTNCDHVVWLDKGKVIIQGSSDVILSAYKAAMNDADR